MAWEYDLLVEGTNNQRFERMTAAVDDMIKAASVIKVAQLQPTQPTVPQPHNVPLHGAEHNYPNEQVPPEHLDGNPQSHHDVKSTLGGIRTALQKARDTMGQIEKAHATLNQLKPAFRQQWSGLMQSLQQTGEQLGQQPAGQAAQRLLAEIRGIRLDQQNPTQLKGWLNEMVQKLNPVGKAVGDMSNQLGSPTKSTPNMFGVGADQNATYTPSATAPAPQAPAVAPTAPKAPSIWDRAVNRMKGGYQSGVNKYRGVASSSGGKFLKKADTETEWTWKIA